MEIYQGVGPEYLGWLIYLRKSRQDDPNETVEEVLAKHEAWLQEYAERELGGCIPEENIYREIVSGESIDERVEVQKVLARIEDPHIKGVLVKDPQRLGRPELEDAGRLINAFRFTHTKVGTPMMVYDLENKMQRKFFQDELLRGRDYLEYTREVLWMGRVAAHKRGCFLGNHAPYGYDKVKIGKDHTLEPNEKADVVRLIFDLYVNELLTPFRIAQRLNEMGIPAPRGAEWKKDTIRTIVKNAHYAGKVVFNKIKKTPVLENGEVVVKRLTQEAEDIIIAEGKHPAIIDAETWEKAQALVARHPRHKHTYELKNPFSGVLVCGKCGCSMYIHPYKHAEDRFECRTAPRCFKSVKYSELTDAILFALEHSELPDLQAKVKNGDGDAAKIQKRLLEKLEKQMEEYRDQEEMQYELLETRRYTQEKFDQRNSVLRAKMEECQKQIYQAKSSMPQNVDYAERVVTLQTAIEGLRDPEATVIQKNRLLKAIVDKIEFEGSPPVDKSIKGFKKNVNDYKLKVTLRL